MNDLAVAFGTINVIGGFLVTDRMLEMFKSKPKSPKPDGDGAGVNTAGDGRGEQGGGSSS